MRRVRLGGFVIHGSNADTLEACLRSLQAVCDELVAVDSGSTDGSAAMARAAGARTLALAWQGYGAARMAAAEALTGCDYLFFLDSDEHLEPDSIAALRRWREGTPTLPFYTLRRRDWAELGGRRFLFRTETRKRLVRRDAAAWHPRMIVHEALPRGASRPSGAFVEHRFATSLTHRVEKDERYCLLWALQAHAEGRRSRLPALRRLAHFVRNAVFKGALMRGGRDGLSLARAVARQYGRREILLREVESGARADLVGLLRADRLQELFAHVEAAPPRRGA